MRIENHILSQAVCVLCATACESVCEAVVTKFPNKDTEAKRLSAVIGPRSVA